MFLSAQPAATLAAQNLVSFGDNLLWKISYEDFLFLQVRKTLYGDRKYHLTPCR